MRAFEVAIVGGGPAGSSTALHLLAARPELEGRIAIFERRALPREKYCAGAVSAWGIAILERLGVDAARDGIEIRALAVRAGRDVGRVEGAGLGRVVRRSVFDERLFRAAVDRGARGFEACAVQAVAREAGGWRLTTDAGIVRAKILVAADGASGAMRRALGLGEPHRRARLYLAETPGPERRDGVCDGTLLFDLGPAVDGQCQGYYWDFPSPLDGAPGTSRGIFHLNAAPHDDPEALKRSFARALATRDLALERLRLKPHSIRPIALGEPASVPGALLVGEAAGVDPITGEGIAHALAYGRLAADTVVDAIARNDRSFADWHLRIAESFVGRHLREASRLAPHVYGPRAARYAFALVRSQRALAMGARWYRGEPIPFAAKIGLLARMAVGLD